MAIEIIDEVRYCTCSVCGNRLKFLQSDVKVKPGRVGNTYVIPSKPYAYIVCPGCNSDLRLT